MTYPSFVSHWLADVEVPPTGVCGICGQTVA